MWGFILDWIIIYFCKLCQHWGGLWPDSNGFPEAHIGRIKTVGRGPRSEISLWTSSSCPQVVRALKPDSSFRKMTNYPATREHRIWPKQNSEVSLGWHLRSKSYIYEYEYTIFPYSEFWWGELSPSRIDAARGWGFVNILSVVTDARFRDFLPSRLLQVNPI